MGKGSSQRPTNKAAFESSYDAIFGKKKPLYEQQVAEEVREEAWDKRNHEEQSKGVE